MVLTPCTWASRRLPDGPLGVNYISRYHLYALSDEELSRDFARFRSDGVNLINLSLYWYRLEGPERGQYHPEFIRNVQHVIASAHGHGLSVLVTMHTLWGDDSRWCTPTYTIDSKGVNRGAAIYVNEDARAGFLETFEWMVTELGEPDGLVGICMLNEPWYWPHEPWKKENFVTLMQRQKDILTKHSPHLLSLIRFVNHHSWNGTKNIFAEDWGYDERVLDCLDVIGLNFYYSEGKDQVCRDILADNVRELAARGKPILVTEFGSPRASERAESYRRPIEIFRSHQPHIIGWMAWMWCSQDWGAGRNDSHNVFDASRGEPTQAYAVMICSPPARGNRGH